MEKQVLHAINKLSAMVSSRFDALESRIGGVEKHIQELLQDRHTRQEATSKRKQKYREKQQHAVSGKIKLPSKHVLRHKDPRLYKHHSAALQEGFKAFAESNDPFGFAAWVAWYWNSEVYFKRPITFSGGYFQVWLGTCRNRYGGFDLMGHNRKQLRVLKNDAERHDFRERPWWDWCYHVLMPLLRWGEENLKMQAHFDRCIRLVLGDLGEYEVFNDQYWGQNSDLPSINKMLKRIAPDLWSMWNGFLKGLRLHTPVPLP